MVTHPLARTAGAVFLAHHLHKGLAEASRADEYLTQSVSAALKVVDVRVLDHVVVSRVSSVSMAERGLI